MLKYCKKNFLVKNSFLVSNVHTKLLMSMNYSMLSDFPMREERKLAARAKMRPKNVTDWSVNDVISWLTQKGHDDQITLDQFREHEIDGKALLTLKEEDLKSMAKLKIGTIKRLHINMKQLQRENLPLLLELGYLEVSTQNFYNSKNSEVSIFKFLLLFF